MAWNEAQGIKETGTEKKRDGEFEGYKEKGQLVFNRDVGVFAFKAD